MKRFYVLFLLSSLFPSFSFAQGAHRVGQVIVKGSGIAANVSPNAKILVCVVNTGCTSTANIYLDAALTNLAPNPVTADSSGNYDYYLASGCVDEQISAPGQGSIFVSNVCPFNGTGGGGATFPSTVAPVVSLTTLTSRPALFTDIVPLWSGGTCSGFLKSDGTCGPGGSPASGPQYALQTSDGSGAFGHSNATTDATGNPLTVPGALTGQTTNGTVNTDFFNTSNNGIAATLASTNCTTSGCLTETPDNSSDTGTITQENANGGQIGYPGLGGDNLTVHDLRSGGAIHILENPFSALVKNGSISADERFIVPFYTKAVDGIVFPDYGGVQIRPNFYQGGSNVFPSENGGAYAFKSNYHGLVISSHFNTPGQHSTLNTINYCSGRGDCILGGDNYSYVSGGGGDNADEGAHPAVYQQHEASRVLVSTCASGCSTGSTSLSITPQSGIPDIAGERNIEDWASPILSSTAGCGLLSGVPQSAGLPTVTLMGTSCAPNSTMMLATTNFQSATNQPVDGIGNGAVGTVTVTIQTTGLPAGFVATTSGLPSSGVACAADYGLAGTASPDYYEQVPYTTIDATHLTVTFLKPHVFPPVISVGGWCGKSLIANANINGTVASITASGSVYQSVPIVGSLNDVLWMGDYARTVSIAPGGAETQAYYQNYAIASIARASNLVTVTLTPVGSTCATFQGLSTTVAGVADASFDGTFTVNQTAACTLTYAQTAADASSSGGTAVAANNAYTVVPVAKIKFAMNAATHNIDGTGLTLYPNTVPWAAGDPIVFPHDAKMSISGTGGYNIIDQTIPLPDFGTNYGQGIVYTGKPGPARTGYEVKFDPPGGDGIYLGHGGTKQLPTAGYSLAGATQNSLSMQAGDHTFAQVLCNAYGCNDWRSKYALFSLQSTSGAGYDDISFDPQARALTFEMPSVAVNALSATSGTFSGTLQSPTIHGTDNPGLFDHGITAIGGGNYGPNLHLFNGGAISEDIQLCSLYDLDPQICFGNPGGSPEDGGGDSFAASGNIWAAQVNSSQVAHVNGVQAGIGVPSHNPMGTFHGTGTGNNYYFGYVGLLPDGSITPLGSGVHEVANVGAIGGANTITGNCPASLQNGYSGASAVYKLVESPNGITSWTDQGTCAVGGTWTYDGTVTTPITIPTVDATASIISKSFGLGPTGTLIDHFQGTTGTGICRFSGTLANGHIVVGDANGNCVDGGALPAITQGTATLVAGTVTVSTSAAVVASDGHYVLTNCGASGTAIGVLSVGTVVAGTSFDINSLTATNTAATGDTSTVCWWIR